MTRATSVDLTLKMEKKSELSTLCLKMKSRIIDSPPFVCDGVEKWNWLATKRQILVHGLGFLGPVDGDGSYDVTVQFRRWEAGEHFDMDKIQKSISAQKGQIFYIMFDEPVTIAEGAVDKWTTYYAINYSLKGPNTESFQRTIGEIDGCAKLGGEHKFRFGWWSNQLAEILYSNM